jgi:hypothetical protein
MIFRPVRNLGFHFLISTLALQTGGCTHFNKSGGNLESLHAGPPEINRDVAGTESSWKYWEVIAASELSQFENIWAISDMHGEVKRAKAVLENAELIRVPKHGPPTWIKRKQLLIVAGDFISKGAESVEVLILFEKLAADAKKLGSQIVMLLGNNEIEFLTGDETGIDQLIMDSAGKNMEWLFPEGFGESLSPRDLSRRSKMSKMIRKMKAAAVIDGKWIFTHSGFFAAAAGKKEVTEIRLNSFLAEIDKQLLKANSLVEDGLKLQGKDEKLSKDTHKKAEEIYRELADENSFFKKHNWWREDLKLNRKIMELKYETLFFGHDPEAFDKNGKIAVTDNGRFVKLDAGMNSDEDKNNKDEDLGGKIMRCPVVKPLSVFDEDGKSICYQRGSEGDEFRLSKAD